MQEAGVCPACGETELEYSNTKHTGDNSMGKQWECPSCRTLGLEAYSATFQRHDILTPNLVLIQVYKGVADLVCKPEGVSVIIRDYDNEEAVRLDHE